MRFEEYSQKWIPAGLSYNITEGKWNKLNIFTDITGISSQNSLD